MSILQKLNMIRHKHSGIGDFCMHTIRFKKLLENATTLLDLFEDGNEKLKGEYILDRHYVTSLIDDIIEKLGMLVYDACTLSFENGDALYAQYDKHKLNAAKLIRENIVCEKKDAPTDEMTHHTPLLYPEYQLLSDVLTWFNGKTQHATVMDLMKQALLTGIGGIESMESVKNETVYKGNGFIKSGNIFYLLDLWKDPINTLTNPRSLEDIDSMPFKLLFTNALDPGLSSSPTHNIPTATWVTAAGEYELSLNTLASRFSFRLDAFVSGHEKSDYIFMFADNSINTDHIFPSGFHTEKTTDGKLAWKRNVSAATLEDNLMTIGQHLFCGSTGKVDD